MSSVDRLYEAVATDPGDWDDTRFVEWTSELTADGPPPPKEAVRQLRAAVRNARKLAKYWSTQQPLDDWAMAVDQALGSMGWDPTLRLAELALESAPTEEAFEEVRRRFRMVNSVPWLEGVSYAEWLDRA